MNESKATRYHRWRRRAQSAGAASAMLMLGVVALTPASQQLANMVEAFTFGWESPLRPTVTLLLFVLLLVLIWELAALPATIYMALRVERAYSPRALRLEDVLGGQVLATAVALPVALLAAVIVRVAVDLAGRAWWVLAGLLVAAALAGALRAAPSLLVRLGEVHPLTRTNLAVHLANLARRADVPVASIEEWRIGEPATAAIVTGVGAGRRVLVSADVLRHWSDDEIAVVVAHELAHHAHHDLWRTWALNAAVLAVGLFVADYVIGLAGPPAVTGGPAALASLPLMALVAALVWMALTPVRHALSRHQERRADSFALALTGNVEAFGAAVRRLGATHLAEDRPSPIARWLFFSHPPMTERLAFAEAYQRRLGTEPARARRSSAER